MRKYIFLLLSISVSSISAAQTAPSAVLDSLVAEALRNNPRILAAREESAAAYTRIKQSTSFEPPQVGIELFQTPISSFPNPVRDGQETDYFIQQMFPFPGKRAAMGNVARNSAAMTDRTLGALERQVIREMKSSYYALYLADRTLEINTRNQDLMRELITVASHQYEVGTGKQADILKAQTELSMLSLSAITLQKDWRVASARVNTVAGRPAGDSLGTVEDIEKDFPVWNTDELDSLALGNRPELNAMYLGIRMKEAELVVSLKERMPDFMVRLMYKDMVMGGTDFWSTMFGVTIPESFWSQGKVQSQIEESRINIRIAQAEYQNMQNEVILQVHEALDTVRADRRTIEFYRTTLIPQTEQTLLSARDGYRAGTVDFMTVIDAARMQLQVRQDYQAAVVSFMESQADLEQAVGMDSDMIARKIHQ